MGIFELRKVLFLNFFEQAVLLSMILNNLVQRLSADVEKLTQGYETAILSAAILLFLVAIITSL